MLRASLLRSVLRSNVSHAARPRNFSTSADEAQVSLSAQLFIDLNWLEKRLILDYASSTFGPGFASKYTVDAAPLRPYFEVRTAEALGKGPVSLSGIYAYFAQHFGEKRGRDDQFPNLLRILTEEGIAVRTYGPQPVGCWAPAAALTADLVHACAIRGADVDTGIPLSMPADAATGPVVTATPGVISDHRSILDMRPADVMIVAGGHTQYVPGLVRATQHGRLTAFAGTKRDWANMGRALPPNISDVIAAVEVDDLLKQMIVPLSVFREGAKPLDELAHSLHATIVAQHGTGSTLNGLEVAVLATRAGLLKELRRANMTLKHLAGSFPDMFALTVDGSKWTASARNPPVTAVIAPVGGSEGAAEAAAAPVEGTQEAAPGGAAASEGKKDKRKGKVGKGKAQQQQAPQAAPAAEAAPVETPAAAPLDAPAAVAPAEADAAPAAGAEPATEAVSSSSVSSGKSRKRGKAAVGASSDGGDAVPASAPSDPLSALLASARAAGFGALDGDKVKVANLKALLAAAGVAVPGSAKLDALKTATMDNLEAIKSKIGGA